MSPMALVSVFLCLTLAGASRAHTRAHTRMDSKVSWGPACDTLQTRFRARSANLQTFMTARDDSDHMSIPTQGRAVMKAAAVLRTLKRGKDCPWAVEGNSGDVEAVSSVVRLALANNPCAPAALAELEGMDRPDGQRQLELHLELHRKLQFFNANLRGLQRATSILLSDNCEADDQLQESLLQVPGDPVDITDDNLLAQVDETEEVVHDIAELMVCDFGQPEARSTPELEITKVGQPEARSTEVGQPEARSKHSWVWMSKLIGAIMLGVLMALACGFAGFFIGLLVGAMLGTAVGTLSAKIGITPVCSGPFCGAFYAFVGADVGSAGGFLSGAGGCGLGWHKAIRESGLLA